VASDVSTIQSLKAVDAWIDVINANINGGVRTAFKSSRLKFSGSNTDVQRMGGSSSLPLQFPEPGLTTANTLIDWTPGALTASTDETHLAIQGHPNRFFILINPGEAVLSGSGFGGSRGPTSNGGMYLTRDGEFHWGPQEDLGDGIMASYLKDSRGNFVGRAGAYVPNGCMIWYTPVGNTEVVRTTSSPPPVIGSTTNAMERPGTVDITDLGSLRYSQYGSTVFVFPPGMTNNADRVFTTGDNVSAFDPLSDGSLLTKTLEASNASMTQSVPELSLAQKLFSALTKVLQTKQTNVDGVLNLVR
jgi:flagellar hook protein FlgE